MSWHTIDRAARAGRDSGDGFCEAVARLLEQVQRTPEIAARIDDKRRKEAERTVADWPTPPDKTREEHIRFWMNPTWMGPRPVMDDHTLIQAGRCARALLRHLGMDQDGEAWPGQRAVSRTWGEVKVVGVEMDGRPKVRQTGWGCYPTDPSHTVDRGDLTWVSDYFHPTPAPLVDQARKLAAFARTTPVDRDGFTYGKKEADEVTEWCDLMEQIQQEQSVKTA